jgi:hypothetical protein
MNQYTRHSFCLVALAGLVTAAVLVGRQFGNGDPMELLAPCVLALLSAGVGSIGLFVSAPADGTCGVPADGHSAAHDGPDLDGFDA